MEWTLSTILFKSDIPKELESESVQESDDIIKKKKGQGCEGGGGICPILWHNLIQMGCENGMEWVSSPLPGRISTKQNNIFVLWVLVFQIVGEDKNERRKSK